MSDHPAGLSGTEIMRVVTAYIGVNGGYLNGFTYAGLSEFYPLYCGLELDPFSSPHSGTTRERFISVLRTSGGGQGFAEPERQIYAPRPDPSTTFVSGRAANTPRSKDHGAECQIDRAALSEDRRPTVRLPLSSAFRRSHRLGRWLRCLRRRRVEVRRAGPRTFGTPSLRQSTHHATRPCTCRASRHSSVEANPRTHHAICRRPVA